MNCMKIILSQLLNKGHKGKNGKVCVIGGSFQFTGAPFFAGMSYLRCIYKIKSWRRFGLRRLL